MFKLCLLLIVPAALGLILTRDSLIVSTRQGFITGLQYTSAGGRSYVGFRGIPYANPPTNERRFLPATEVDPEDMYFANTSKPACIQSGITRGNPAIFGSEDCLYLNIYTPTLPIYPIPVTTPTSPARPVIIYFPGALYSTGDANFEATSPAYFMDFDVVLVVASTRLGILGYLSTGDEQVPGNLGLKDQSFVINWVWTNIAAFGGNPYKITVMGQSAGGANAHLHMLSPLSRDLLHGVIAQSGTAVSPWVISSTNEAVTNGRRVATLVGCPTQNTNVMVNCLRGVDARTLISATDALFFRNNSAALVYPLNPFRPVIEAPSESAFLTRRPQDMITSNDTAVIPLLLGVSAQNGGQKSAAIFRNDLSFQFFRNNINTILPQSLFYDRSSQAAFVTGQVSTRYWNNRPLANTNEFRDIFTNLYTHVLFSNPSNLAMSLHRGNNDTCLYYYDFAYRGTISFCQFVDPNYNYGVCDGDELQFMFPPNSYVANYRPTGADNAVRAALLEMWINFANISRPVSTRISVQWQPVRTDNLEYYLIQNGTSATMSSQLYWNFYQFWRSMPVNN